MRPILLRRGSPLPRLQWRQPTEEAATSTASRVWTYADLEQMPESEDGRRYEIIDGDLIATASPIPLHQLVLIRATRGFDRAALAADAGVVLTAPIDVRFAPRQVAVPDLLFIARDRLDIIGPKAIEAAPDIVVEIFSPSTRSRDRGRKMDMYARFGVREYRLIDPEAGSVVAFELRNGHYQALPQEGGVARSKVLPGLAIDLASLFLPAGG
ncbi:MAG: Uma2 family endonuclease [Chloroflexota bacterium]|nr:Uma2 family endonuclease [Chloroflexota bacterium]